MIFLILFLFPSALSADTHLETLEITGELRRPGLQWVDSSEKIQEILPDLYRKHFQNLEEQLLMEESKK